jgi:hypothetical protein
VRRLATALLVVAALGGCGVKAPPRAAGTSDQTPPSERFKPAVDPGRPPSPGEEPSR